MEKHLLSKSSYLKGVQCEKALYLYKHYYHLKDPISAERQALFDRGNQVGKLAWQRFPGGADSSPPGRFKFREAVQLTQQFLQAGKTVIYEATFQAKQVLVMVDILVKEDHGWVAYEVKSSSKITPVFTLDTALQYYVIREAGFELADMRLIHIDTNYERHGDLDPQQLFTSRSLLAEIQPLQDTIAQNISHFKEVLAAPATPQRSIGPHCFDPYPCDFMGQCWSEPDPNSIFDLISWSKEQQFEWFQQGVRSYTQLPEETQLSPLQQLQISTTKSGQEHLDSKAIQAFLEPLKFPLGFLDFEVFMPAVPLFDHTRPYQNLPFQFSLHSLHESDASLTHTDFLAEAGIDPREALMHELLEQTSHLQTIVAYDDFLERKVIKDLAANFPEHQAELEALLDKLVDLQKPFTALQYYHPDMQGHHSLKAVSEVLASDVDYSRSPVSSGRLASHAFMKLHRQTDLFEGMEIRENLLEYCKTDTLAMVRIYQALREKVR